MEYEGPRPMRNMRPAKKHHTGADKFYSDHQTNYQERGHSGKDAESRVHAHNSAYPKLIDELEKRRSIADNQKLAHDFRGCWRSYNSTCRVKAIPRDLHMYDMQLYDSQRAVVRASNLSNRKSNRGRGQLCGRCRRTRHPKTSNRRPRNGIMKRRQRTTRRYRKTSKMTMSRGCQYYCLTPFETKSVSTYDDVSDNSENAPGSSRNCNNRQLHENNVNDNAAGKCSSSVVSRASKHKSEVSPKRTNPPSLSSYNSFVSLDHEPMVE